MTIKILRLFVCAAISISAGRAPGVVLFSDNFNTNTSANWTVNKSPAGVRRSRVVTSEVLMVTPAVGNLIANAKSSQIYSTMETGTALGMQTLEQDLARLWVAGAISETTAATMARNPAVMRDRANLLRKPSPRPMGATR